MKWHNNTEEEYREAAKNSKSIAEMCRYLGRTPYGAGYYLMHKKIKEYNIDTTHFVGQGWNTDGKNLLKSEKTPDEKIFVEHSTFQRCRLKNRLIEGGYKKAVCEKCGRTEWEGKPIPLEIHHVNGIHDDNRLENLQILCPNCHAQTDNYCSKNIRKKRIVKIEKGLKNTKKEKTCPICGASFFPERDRQKYCSVKCAHKAIMKMPEKEVLSNLIKDKSNHEISEIYNVTDSSIRKWRKYYKI